MIRRHRLVLEAATPIAHFDTSNTASQSNTRLFMRQGRIVDGVLAPTPHLSENSLRHTLFREPLADHLVDRLELGREHLPRAVVNLLYSGGQMGGASLAADSVVLGHALKRLYPSLDLLGGAVDAFILPPGRLRLGAWLVTRENVGALKLLFPDLVRDDLPSGHDLLWDETRTRGAGGERSDNQMLYSYETLAAGAQVAIELTLDSHTAEATAAALGHALAVWPGYFGGQGRQGRGRMVVIDHDLPNPVEYWAHLDKHADAMRAGLLDGTFGTGRVLCA